MREGTANGGVDRYYQEGGGAEAAAAAPAGAVGRQRQQPQSNPSSSGTAASSSSSSGRGEAAAEDGGGGRSKQGRRSSSKRREDVVRAIRDRLPAAPACWGNVSVVRERRGRLEWPSRCGGDAVAVQEEEEEASGAGGAALPEWCCLGGDCSLEPNPSANGKEDPGLRSLLERNDFYSDDCNPHAATSAAAANDDGDDVASQAADFD